MKQISYIDKSTPAICGGMRGSCKDNIFTFWSRDTSWKKSEYSYQATLNEVNQALLKYANHHYAIQELLYSKAFQAYEQWIENSPTDTLKQKRREHWENEGKYYFDIGNVQVDSARRVLCHLYEQVTGYPPDQYPSKLRSNQPMNQ